MDDFIDIDESGEVIPPAKAPTTPEGPRRPVFTPAKPARKWDRREREAGEHHATEAHGRIPPHSIEAEEQTLSACLLDGGDAVAKCLALGVSQKTFYVPANRVVFEKLEELHRRKLPIDTSVLAEELKASRMLKEVGGYAYLTRISGRIPTTAGLGYFVRKIRELEHLRDLINAATLAVERCYGYTGPEDLPKIAAPLAIAWQDTSTPLERLESRHVRHEEPPPPAQVILSIANRPIATQGNIQAIIAQAKAGKTTLIGGAMTAILIASGIGSPTADTLGWRAEPIGNRVLIYIDTELSPNDHWVAIDRFMRRANHKGASPEWLWNYCLTGLPPEEIKQGIEALVSKARTMGRPIYAIILDGVADLAASVNDEEESTELVAKLHMLAIETCAPVVCVMHRNEGEKADTAARGHLGKQLARKAETNLRLEKRNGISYVFAENNRGAPIAQEEGPAFKWNEHALMHTSISAEEKRGFLEEVAEAAANPQRKRNAGQGGAQPSRPAKRSYTEDEILQQFPFGESNALPLPLIKKKAMANLGMSEAQFKTERFNLFAASLINKVTLPTGEERYYR